MRTNHTGNAMRASVVLWALWLASCSSHGGDGASSGSHWLACMDVSACVNHPDAVACTDGFCVDAAGAKVEGAFAACSADVDCTGMANAMRCGADGFCVDVSGRRIVLPPPTGGSGAAGSSTAGTGTSGSGGSSAGTGASGSGGGASGTGASGSGGSGGAGTGGDCPPNTPIPASCRICLDGSCGVAACDSSGFTGFVCPEDGTGGTGGGSTDAGVGVVLPNCDASAGAADASCSGPDNSPPECCLGNGVHLRCEYAGCTSSQPGTCSGSWSPVAGSTLCGGYQPCAGKACGDYCTICDPSDTGCFETQEIKTCDMQGQCMSGTATCDEPASCDLQATDSCPNGQACCAVGRCGPVVRDQGMCEPADAMGNCMPCACEMQPGGCPICNSPDTPILTPDGERAVADLREGDLVMSVHEGEVVAVPVLATRSVRVFDHAVVRLSLDNGEQIEVSGSHPTADGRRLDSLVPGDMLGDVMVVAVELVPYTHERTYDILPASDSGTYFAAGAWLGSTLFR